MKRLSLWILASAVLGLAAPPLFAVSGSKTRVVSRKSPGARSTEKATAASYSAQLNIATRVQGTSFFRTAVDITNNTDSNPVTATIQYCYTFNGTFQGCSQPIQLSLVNFDNFHTDDIVQYLGSQGVLVPGADQLSFGTLLVTFDGLPSTVGWEGTVTGRTYSPYDQANPSLGTVAIAYPGSLFFESATGSLVGIIRDTLPAPTEAGALRTNLGVTNTDIYGHGDPITIAVTFYDVTPGSATNGQQVGGTLTRTLEAGEVFQFTNVFSLAAIPTNVDSCITFVDITSDQSGANPGTIEGYVNILDDGTRDGAYFEMKCAAGCP